MSAVFCLQSLSEPYRAWAEGHVQRVKDILNNARSEHTQAVKERIASVEKMKDVVSVTEGLFAISKETAQLEHDVFVQRQKVQLATELKSVLDSWVRFEQQEKENEQAELAKTVIDNVLKSIRDEKTQRDILAGAVSEVERKSDTSVIGKIIFLTALFHRACQEQEDLECSILAVSSLLLEMYLENRSYQRCRVR